MKARFGAGTLAPEELPGKLEQTLALGRNSWPLSAIRRLSDRLLELAEARRKSAALEMRWLNLCGFMLRPGFGFPGDDFRIEQARRIYSGGLQFPNQVQNEIDWWIFWGRVAGGLNKNQQVDMFQRLSPVLLPRGSKRPRVNNSLLREMWRTAASLELLPLQTKTQLGDALLAQGEEGRDGGHRPVVPVADRRAQAVLRPDQSGDARASGDALGGSAAQSPQGRGCGGRDRPAHGRFHARSESRRPWT